MGFEQRDNSGALFKEEKKSEKHPDYKGNALIGGKKYWISLWRKDGKNGPFLSLAFEEAKPKAAEAPRRAPIENERDPW